MCWHAALMQEADEAAPAFSLSRLTATAFPLAIKIAPRFG